MKIVVCLTFTLVAALMAVAIPPAWKVQPLQPPAGQGSGEANLTSHGSVAYLTWYEKGALRFSGWNGSHWDEATTIASGHPFFVNWADFPSMLVMDRQMVVHWPEKSDRGLYAYDVMVSVSSDFGKTWTAPVKPHHDGVKNEHGFVSLFDLGQGNFGAVWLDARKFKPGSEHDLTNEMALYYSKNTGGKFEPEIVLDERVCDCCQTSAALLPDGVIVVYRDRSLSEVRDIGYVRLVNRKWTPPAILHPDGWKIAACPVNGPAVASEGNYVAVAWFTGAQNRPRVHVSFSTDGGKTFGKPLQIDQGKPNGRVDVEWLDKETAVVSWLEVVGKGAEIRIRAIHADGTMESPFTVADSSTTRASGFPRMTRLGKDLLLTWTDVNQDTRQVRVVRLRR